MEKDLTSTTYSNKRLENIDGMIKNGQSRETGNIGEEKQSKICVGLYVNK